MIGRKMSIRGAACGLAPNEVSVNLYSFAQCGHVGLAFYVGCVVLLPIPIAGGYTLVMPHALLYSVWPFSICVVCHVFRDEIY